MDSCSRGLNSILSLKLVGYTLDIRCLHNSLRQGAAGYL